MKKDIYGFGESASRAPRGEAMPVSLRLVFVGRDAVANWGDLRDVIHRSFGAMAVVTTIGQIADLDLRDTKGTDIVFIQGTGDRCSTKTRLKIAECCPIASTIYLTKSSRAAGDHEVIEVPQSRSIPFEQVLRAILSAMRSQICGLKLALGSPQPSPLPHLPERLRLLTPRQTKVLVAVLEGVPNKLVARDMNITVRTVKAHLTEIFRKTGVSQRAELIAKCSQLASAFDVPTQQPLDLQLRDGRASLLPFARRQASKQLAVPKAGSKSAPQFKRACPTHREGRIRPFAER